MSSPSAVNHPELFESRSVVDERHNQILERAVQNILSTDIAELAYAQIIDGLPLRSAYHKAFPRIEDHPVNVLAHKELCPGSLERAREVRKEFALSHLWFQKPVSSLPFSSLDRFPGLFICVATMRAVG